VRVGSATAARTRFQIAYLSISYLEQLIGSTRCLDWRIGTVALCKNVGGTQD
jgi:hypothetical protein